nr:hypothetical protein [Tanacetum cinerariifolium]
FDQPQPPQSPVIHQPPQEMSIQEMEDLKQQYLDKLKCLSNLEYRDEIKIAKLKEDFNDEFIKSSVENLIPIPSESVGIPKHMCDVPSHDNSPPLDTKSSSTSLNSLLEETNNFDNSLPEFTTFSKEIDLFCTLDYPMPSGTEDKDYDSERDILIRKDLPRNNTLSFAEKESFHFDIPPFSRPLAKPPDGDTGILNIKMMGDISDQKDFMHKLMITLASHQEKSPDLLSHQGLKAFQSFAKCPMMIHGQNNPILDVLLFYFYPP